MGNWKAAGTTFRVETFRQLVEHLPVNKKEGDIVIAPPIIYAGKLAEQLEGTGIDIGA